MSFSPTVPAGISDLPRSATDSCVLYSRQAAVATDEIAIETTASKTGNVIASRMGEYPSHLEICMDHMVERQRGLDGIKQFGGALIAMGTTITLLGLIFGGIPSLVGLAMLIIGWCMHLYGDIAIESDSGIPLGIPNVPLQRIPLEIPNDSMRENGESLDLRSASFLFYSESLSSASSTATLPTLPSIVEEVVESIPEVFIKFEDQQWFNDAWLEQNPKTDYIEYAGQKIPRNVHLKITLI